MSSDLVDLTEKIKQIEKRNQRVEADKSWETSWTRRGLLALFSYIAVGAYLQAINIERPWINAIVPAVAFMIQTLTLPLFKRLWLDKYNRDSH